jgi:proline iminopeptidase
VIGIRDVEERVPVDDGVVLWTATGGSGSVPVVFCHGGAGLWDYLQPVAESLSSVARVHGWERRGCGRSDRVGPYSITRYIDDLEFLRRHFGHERWMAVGHSWGAGLALRYALAHPERVVGVLYVAGTGVGQAWREAYHREADRRLTAKQRGRRSELKQRRRTPAEEREWRVLSYMSDVGDPDARSPARPSSPTCRMRSTSSATRRSRLLLPSRSSGLDLRSRCSSAPKAWDSGDRTLASRPRAEAAPIGRLTLRR